MQIAKAVDILLSASPYMEEALMENLINISALARKIKPDVERLTHKKVQENAIIMAISRRPPSCPYPVTKGIRDFMEKLGDLIVRSGLSDHTFENSATLPGCQRQLMEAISNDKDVFCTFSQGVMETTIVTSSSLDKTIKKIFAGEKRISQQTGLSSVSIRLPRDNTRISGIYYHILKQLAWAGINICEVISTSNEISIVVSEQDVRRAFPILMGLKQQQHISPV